MISLRFAVLAVLIAAAVAACLTYFVTRCRHSKPINYCRRPRPIR
jgi:hypothetical protein